MAMDWSFWKRWLKDGVPPQDMPLTDGMFYPFYGHDHEFNRVAIWQAKDGTWVASFNGKKADAARLFAGITRPKKLGTATTVADWEANRDSGTPFPKQREQKAQEDEREQIAKQQDAERLAAEEAAKPAEEDAPSIGHNSGSTEISNEARILDEIENLARTYRAEEARIASKPQEADTEETYKFFSNIAMKAADLANEGEALRKAEKAPLLQKGKEIDGRWHKVTDPAITLKGAAQKATLPYHTRIKKEQELAAKRAAENREKMDADTRIAKRASGGTKTVTVNYAEVTDAKAFCLYLCQEKDFPAELNAVLGTIATKRVIAGITDMPGVTMKTTTRVSN